MITGAASRKTIREINVEGTLNTSRRGVGGSRRFVYASSVAVYGLHSDNPLGSTRSGPRPAELSSMHREGRDREGARRGVGARVEPELYLLRPPVVLGPHAVGAKSVLPGPLDAVGRRLGGVVRGLPLPLPVRFPRLPTS